MTEIHLEKKKQKKGLAWLWVLPAAAVVAGLIIWAVADDDDEAERTAAVTEGEAGEEEGVFEQERSVLEEEEAKPADEQQPSAEPPEAQQQQPSGEAIPIAAILEEPTEWQGRTISGTADVASVPTDRGFFIQSGGQQLFVVLDPRLEESPYRVETNNRVRIEEATVRDASYAREVSGQLTADTRNILEDQSVFLLADGENVSLLPGAWQQQRQQQQR